MNPVEKPTAGTVKPADLIAGMVALEVAHQLGHLEERIGLLERAVADLQDRER
jgi:hypothetical protein